MRLTMIDFKEFLDRIEAIVIRLEDMARSFENAGHNFYEGSKNLMNVYK